jgi:glycosyltransferase involved in cell wall biosynthesis
MLYSDEISIRRASAVATVSDTSRRDILATWRVRENRLVVTSEGIDDRFFSQISDKEIQRVAGKYSLTSPYILYLGGLDKRKDVVTLVEAYAAWKRPDVRCVIAGPTRGELAEVKLRIATHGLKEGRVAVLGEVEDQDVPALYASAACFVYPSRYEGFGLQAAEAMAMGVPVIVSNGGALPEVVGDAALVFSIGDTKGLVEHLDQIFADRNLRHSLVERGRRRAECFRWQSVAPAYVSLYRRLIGC